MPQRYIESLGQELGTQVATQGLNLGMGLLLGGINDRRQLKQQEKLQNLEIKGQKEMGDYNYQKQLDMWNATNYKAQMDHLKNAGLNPGLIYGMGGAGGATTGSQGGNVTGSHAPTGGGEAIATMGMGIQYKLLEAQKRVLETQADKNEAEANKTKGVDTTESETRTQSLLQGIQNAKAQESILKIEKNLKEIELADQKYTQEDRQDYIYYQTKLAMQHLEMAERESFIQKATLNQKIDIIRAEAIGAILKNALTKAQTQKTQSDITLNQEQIKKWTTELSQGWQNLSRQEKELKLRTLEVEIKAQYPGLWNVIGAALNSGLRQIDKITGQEHMDYQPQN